MSEPKAELKPLVLKSSQWLRGEYTQYDGSCLYDGGRKHQFCCLGVLAKECGIPPRKLRDKADPVELLEDKNGDMVKTRDDLPEGLRWCVNKRGRASRDCNLAIRANDDTDITDAKRLKKLVPIFRRNGWDLQFVDDES